MFAMLQLGPGVGKIKVQRGDGIRRQQPLQEIRAFDPQPTQIIQPAGATFAIQFAQPAQQSLDAQKIVPGMARSIIREKRSVAAAKFHLQWLLPDEQGVQINSVNNGGEIMNQRRRDGGRHADGLAGSPCGGNAGRCPRTPLGVMVLPHGKIWPSPDGRSCPAPRNVPSGRPKIQ